MSSIKPKDINLFLGKLYQQVKKTATLPAKAVKGKPKQPEKDLILFVGALFGHMIDAVRDYEKANKVTFRLGLIHDKKQKIDQFTNGQLDRIDVHIACDMNSEAALQTALAPYQTELLAITCRPESRISDLRKIIPNIPYVNAPTTDSLWWSSDKIATRQRLSFLGEEVNPRFSVVHDDSKKSVEHIVEKVGFPLVVKPSGMAASQLVSICYHKEELESVLSRVVKKLKTNGKKDTEPDILVEQFMEGDMYSLDAYVDSRGNITFCPMCHITTGKAIGFDDFFGYRQMTPTNLSKESIAAAQLVAAKAIYAMGLRSTTVHIELMRLEDGWKIIETGPRMGGFRHMMYDHSYGINHVMNDVLTRLDKKPTIPKTVKGYTVAMKFFAQKEGKLKSITGIKKAQTLGSFKRLYINKHTGDMCRYAKHGGESVFNIIMFHKDRSELLADIRRLEQMIVIDVE